MSATDRDAAREQIEETREALGDTVEQLVHKADVKARVKDDLDDRKRDLRIRLDHLASSARDHPAPLVAALVFLAVLLLTRPRG
jgi:uncharacterized protein DUF3618